jgi:hypothetical protein
VDYATTVLNANDASETQTVNMWTDWASSTYGNADGHSFCGARTYTLQNEASYTWYTLTRDTATQKLTGVIDATTEPDINYVGYSDAGRSTCWPMTIDGSITATSQI